MSEGVLNVRGLLVTCVFPFSSCRGQCVRQYRPAQLSTWIHQQQHLNIHPSVILFFVFPVFLFVSPALLPLNLPPGSKPLK